MQMTQIVWAIVLLALSALHHCGYAWRAPTVGTVRWTPRASSVRWAVGESVSSEASVESSSEEAPRPAYRGVSQRKRYRDLRALLESYAENDASFFIDPHAVYANFTLCLPANRDGSQPLPCPDSHFLKLVMKEAGIVYREELIVEPLEIPVSALPILRYEDNPTIRPPVSGATKIPLSRREKKIPVSERFSAQLQKRRCTLKSHEEFTCGVKDNLDMIARLFPKALEPLQRMSPKESNSGVSNRTDLLQWDIVESVRQPLYDFLLNAPAGDVTDTRWWAAQSAILDLNARLATSPGRFIGGLDMSLTDLALAAVLYDAAVGCRAIHRFDVIAGFGSPWPLVERLMRTISWQESFASTRPSPSAIVQRWKKLLAVRST